MTPTITVSLRLLSLSKGTINTLLFGKPIFYYSEAVIETCAPYEIYATLINFAKQQQIIKQMHLIYLVVNVFEIFVWSTE